MSDFGIGAALMEWGKDPEGYARTLAKETRPHASDSTKMIRCLRAHGEDCTACDYACDCPACRPTVVMATYPYEGDPT